MTTKSAPDPYEAEKIKSGLWCVETVGTLAELRMVYKLYPYPEVKQACIEKAKHLIR